MAQTVQGVVARGRGEPVSLERVVVPDPGPGEAVVRVRGGYVGPGVHAGPKWEVTFPPARSSLSVGTNQDETPGRGMATISA